MPMRLVRDDEETGTMLMEEEQTERSSRKRGKKPAVVERSIEDHEQPDGVVADAEPSVEATESASEAAPAEPEIESSRTIEVDVALLEALLFSTHHPLTAGRLAEMLDLESTKPIRPAIKTLNEQYSDTNRCFRVEQVAGGYQLLTLPQYGDILKKLHQREADTKLTKAALETLAIVAYKQPILRADLEAIRGVACGETIRSLMEKHLVKIAGRAEEPGRPILYGTTKRFLELFGLNSLKDLPQSEQALKPPVSQ
jgi:segregation and condensation protein B